jgi:hypothetical protein
LFQFTKQWHSSKAFIVCNFSKKQQHSRVPSEIKGAQLLVGTLPDASSDILQPFEGRVYLL